MPSTRLPTIHHGRYVLVKVIGASSKVPVLPARGRLRRAFWRPFSPRSAKPGRRHLLLVTSVLAAIISTLSPATANAQQGGGSTEGDGEAAAKRLQQEERNKFRGGVGSKQEVFDNMKELFEPILVTSKDDGKADEWYSPHLRDQKLDQQQIREREAPTRGEAHPREADGLTLATRCLNWCRLRSPFIPPPPNINACALCDCPSPQGGEFWHGKAYFPHRPLQCCFRPHTEKYKELTTNSNFKACCVRRADRHKSSEEIACEHPDGSGWAGMFEYYFPTAALGWENDRTTTMIVEKSEVKKCIDQSDKLMEEDVAVDWVAKAIERNQKWADKANGGSGGSSGGDVRGKVQAIIKDVRKLDKADLKFADSLQSEGLTLRPNFAALDPKHRKILAARVCGREEQFLKLFDPAEDKLQWKGGPELEDLQDTNKIPVWSNYCKEGVNLMTNPDKSSLENLDNTPTDFKKGMTKWTEGDEDSLFCQRMNLKNQNMGVTKIGDVIKKSGQNQPTEDEVGHTCLVGEDGSLNGAMIPVTLNRHAAVERRTAIADHALGFLIAGGLAEGMHQGKRSNFKRFEPQPYSNQMKEEELNTFRGKQWEGGETNELGTPCPVVNGKNFEGKTKSDQLYLSKHTHASFNQKPIHEESINMVTHDEKFERYVQGWAGEEEKSQDDIAKRGLDKESSNYAAPFRIFATCPKGYVRWRPPEDHDYQGLVLELDRHCAVENFGGEPEDLDY